MHSNNMNSLGIDEFLDHTCDITTNTISLPSNEDLFVVGVQIFECY